MSHEHIYESLLMYSNYSPVPQTDFEGLFHESLCVLACFQCSEFVLVSPF